LIIENKQKSKEVIVGAFKRKLKTRGERWYASGMYLGKKYHSLCIFKTKAQALKWERQKREEIEEEFLFPRSSVYLDALIADRLEDIRVRKSPDYLRESKRYFEKALAHFGNCDIRAINKAMVFQLLQSEAARLQREGKGYFKVNSMLRSLKALFNFAIKYYDVDKNPCLIDFYPITINLKYIPPDGDIEAVKAACNGHQRLLLDFVDETGCRILEAVRLKWEDIENGLVTLWTRKAKNSNFTPRRIPIPECLKGRKGKGQVFPYSKLPRFLERIIAKKKQKVWSWHCLRHRRASIWASQGMPTIEIMARLGHSNIATTNRYLQLLGYTRL
jgi:integrase